MASDRMARRHKRTAALSALDFAGRLQFAQVGQDCHPALENRARLRGTQSGVRAQPIRREELQGLSSPRLTLYRRLRFSRGRMRPFFPLMLLRHQTKSRSQRTQSYPIHSKSSRTLNGSFFHVTHPIQYTLSGSSSPSVLLISRAVAPAAIPSARHSMMRSPFLRVCTLNLRF